MYPQRHASKGPFPIKNSKHGLLASKKKIMEHLVEGRRNCGAQIIGMCQFSGQIYGARHRLSMALLMGRPKFRGAFFVGAPPAGGRNLRGAPSNIDGAFRGVAQNPRGVFAGAPPAGGGILRGAPSNIIVRNTYHAAYLCMHK